MSFYVFRDFSQIAIFSIECWFFSENRPYIAEFSLFCIFAYYFQNYSLNLCIGPIYSQFQPMLGELKPFLVLKVSFFGHFYKGLYIRKVRFSDTPGRTRMAVESRHAIFFSFRKKFWWERCQQIHMYHFWKWPQKFALASPLYCLKAPSRGGGGTVDNH